MKRFESFAEDIKALLTIIVKTPELHAKWLNTLSYLENSGARKIASCEHATLVKEEILKHAAEEFRHAHYLKRQIEKVSLTKMETYSPSYILGGVSTLNYLAVLDLKTSRYLKQSGLSKSAVREYAYLLVTYAIELRAGEMYVLYDEILRKCNSRVAVKSILLEEKEHLNEMKAGIRDLDSGFLHADYVCAVESKLCKKWLNALVNGIVKLRNGVVFDEMARAIKR